MLKIKKHDWQALSGLTRSLGLLVFVDCGGGSVLRISLKFLTAYFLALARSLNLLVMKLLRNQQAALDESGIVELP